MVAPEQRAEAYRLFDEAVRARHEERLQGAYNAVNEARRLDPDLPGVDLFVGEIAWEQREADTVRRAAREALSRGHNVSSAKLLLALEKWMSRTPQDTVAAGASVTEMLTEAADSSPSNASAPFFHGEVSRLLGDPATAHRKLLGALYRQAPWQSASLLDSKLQIAVAEAVELERPASAPAPGLAAQTALELWSARNGEDEGVRKALEKLLFVTPILQARLLLRDQAFGEHLNTVFLQRLAEELNQSGVEKMLEFRAESESVR